jgi:hypothetical protein
LHNSAQSELTRSHHSESAEAFRRFRSGGDARPQPLHLGMRYASGLLAIYIAAARTTERDMGAHRVWPKVCSRCGPKVSSP